MRVKILSDVNHYSNTYVQL